LFKKTKLRIYKILIRILIQNACGAWASTKSDEKKLILFEREIVGKIYGARRNENMSTYKQRINTELKSIVNESDTVGILKSKIIGWTEHV